MKLDCLVNVCPSVMNKKISCFLQAFVCCCCALHFSARESVEGRSLGSDESGLHLAYCLFQLLILTAVAALAQQSELCFCLQNQSLAQALLKDSLGSCSFSLVLDMMLEASGFSLARSSHKRPHDCKQIMGSF